MVRDGRGEVEWRGLIRLVTDLIVGRWQLSPRFVRTGRHV